jgi:tetratricopeptide (TPR) repeat protein
MRDHVTAPAPLSDHGIKREGLITRAVDWVFGYDFFISYSHGDGMRLPRRLKERLEQAGFRAFLDQTEYVAGADLRRETRRQVVKSRKIVVIGRSGALKSEWVRREVNVALAHGKIPVIVNLNGAVEAAPEDAAVATMAREAHWLRLTETLADPDGEPSEQMISELVRGFNHTRQETKRQRIFATAAAVLALTAAAATWQAVEATRAKIVAEAQRDRAQRILDQVIGNAYRRVETLSMQVKREREARETKHAIPVKVLQPAAAISQSPLKQANDVMTKGSALLASGDARTARLLFEQAMRILESGTEPQAAEPQWLLARFAVYKSLADAAIGDGDPDAALAILTKGLDFLQQRAAADTDDLAWHQRLAVFHQGIGTLDLRQGRMAEAETQYRESISLWRKLASTPSLLPDAQRELALALRRLGDLEMKRPDAEPAFTLFKECISLLERLPTAANGDAGELGELGLSYDRLGQALAQLGREGEALESYGKGVTLFEAAADAVAAEPSWQRNAAATLQKLGDLQGKMGRLDEALHSFRRALSLREGLAVTNSEWQNELEVAYRHVSEFLRPIVGREAEALETAEQYVLATSFMADISQAERVGRALGTLSWSALLARDFPRAKWAGEHAADLAPKLDWVKLNYAHALMLSGHQEQAKEIYLTGAFSAEALPNWKSQIFEDFEEMEKRHISDTLMTEVSTSFNR